MKGEGRDGKCLIPFRECSHFSPKCSFWSIFYCVSISLYVHVPVEAKGYGERKAGRTRASRIRDWYRGRKREDRGKKGKIRLFGAPLSTVIINGQLPDILQVQCFSSVIPH